jgi:hypothetical protein
MLRSLAFAAEHASCPALRFTCMYAQSPILLSGRTRTFDHPRPHPLGLDNPDSDALLGMVHQESERARERERVGKFQNERERTVGDWTGCILCQVPLGWIPDTRCWTGVRLLIGACFSHGNIDPPGMGKGTLTFDLPNPSCVFKQGFFLGGAWGFVPMLIIYSFPLAAQLAASWRPPTHRTQLFVSTKSPGNLKRKPPSILGQNSPILCCCMLPPKRRLLRFFSVKSER